METIMFQIFEKFSQPKRTCTESRLVAGLKGDKMKSLIMPIRDLILNEDKEKADVKKKLLPAITISGTFAGGRKSEHLVAYSHIICLDLDYIPKDKLPMLKEIAIHDPHTRMAFISPSGLGLKILVEVDSGSNYHKDAYKQVVDYYSKKMNVKFDESTNDITRLTFMSYDPHVYHAPNSTVFSVTTPIGKSKEVKEYASKSEMADQSKYTIIYDRAFQLTSKKHHYAQGNRNNFIFQLASYCNLFGLPILALESLLDWCDLPEKSDSVNSAYKRTEQFDTWTLEKVKTQESTPTLKSESYSDQDDVQDEVAEATTAAPILPEEVYELLPDFLQDITSRFSIGVNKDIVLLSCIGVLSSVFPNVRGMYAGSSICLNLFQLFVAPPSSGKGQMKWSEALGKEIENDLQQKFKREWAIYMAKEPANRGEPPVAKKFFIASDSSNIALANQMRENNNIGVMHDSEGGTLGVMFKTDWANPLNILLKSFENESLSINRKNKAESFRIEKCFLSLVMSTTPNQLSKIVGSIESGLYSRFMIYFFQGRNKWKDQFFTEADDLEPIFDEAAKKVLAMYKASEAANTSIIRISEEQRLETFDFFTQKHEQFHEEFDEVLLANVRRSCVMYYKIAMILTTLRAYQTNQPLPEKLIIYDQDHRAALLIVETLLEHVKIVYDKTQQEQNSMPPNKKTILLSKLPIENFTKVQYLSISSDLAIKKATAEKWLESFRKEGKINKIEHAVYKKAA